MKKRLFTLLVAAALGITSIGGLPAASASGFGAAGAGNQSSYTLPEMLTYAIQDEYLAQAEYQKIIDGFDVQRPFTNIIKAEQQHISELLPLFAAYGLEVPVNDAATRTSAPASLLDAYQAGVEAEETNIAMYESFLKQELPADVRAVFEELRDASQNHLAAFQRNLERTAGRTDSDNPGMRGGQGAGQGTEAGLGYRNRQEPANLGGQGQCDESGQGAEQRSGQGWGAGMSWAGRNQS